RKSRHPKTCQKNSLSDRTPKQAEKRSRRPGKKRTRAAARGTKPHKRHPSAGHRRGLSGREKRSEKPNAYLWASQAHESTKSPSEVRAQARRGCIRNRQRKALPRVCRSRMAEADNPTAQAHALRSKSRRIVLGQDIGRRGAPAKSRRLTC